VKRFEFQLQRLARVRKVQEDLARAAWQAAEAAARELARRVEAAEAGILEAVEDLRTLQSSPRLEAAQLIQAQQAVQLLSVRREALVGRQRDAQAEADRLREPWQALRTELEGLRRLEEKARERHRLEAERIETNETDQVAMERARQRRLDEDRRGA
jgi:flagellar export protein FliJ